MIKENDFFKDGFINYYNIDMKKIEELFSQVLASDDIYGLSLSDYESNIILFPTNNTLFQDETINNNKIISKLTHNLNIKDFKEFIFRTEENIYISTYINWKRDMILYIIFNTKNTNLALSNNKVKCLVSELKKILQN